MSSRCRFSGSGELKSATGIGINPIDGWGVSQRDRGKPRRKRSEGALSRRRARRAAGRQDIPLKSYLRKNAFKASKPKLKSGR